MVSMRNLIWLAGLLAGSSTAAVISGVVVDGTGKAIEGARIDHIGKKVIVVPPEFERAPSADQPRTAAEGSFEVTTTKPFFVIRKPGYTSQRIRVTKDAKLRITLQPIQPFPDCKVKIPPIKARRSGDVDYVGLFTYIDTKNGPKGIMAGGGATYTLGAPSDADVWTSLEYFEVMYQNGVVDARGRAADGTYWRSQSIIFKGAQYDQIDRDTAEILNCIMDRAPLQLPSYRSSPLPAPIDVHH